MKYFLITIDTEGDNQWRWKWGSEITVDNVRYLPRFQELCNRYGFKPVWLSNYEMMQNAEYVEFISSVEDSMTGELGMHLHGWSTPPFYSLPIEEKGAPYLTEYPTDIMEEKISVMTDIIKSRTGIKPVSHRAGRWSTDERYFALLSKYGYLVDCSVTPHVNWQTTVGTTKGFGGTDYTNFSEIPYFIGDTKLLEVPVTIRRSHALLFEDDLTVKNIMRSFYRVYKGQNLWCNPNLTGIHGLRKIVNYISDSGRKEDDYLMFFTHSSQLMPGGSPQYRTVESIEKLYNKLEMVFNFIAQRYTGITLREYRLLKTDNNVIRKDDEILV